MAENVTVIEVLIKTTDQTAAGANSATQNISKIEKAMKKMQAEADKMSKMSKIELTMYAIDKASKVMTGVWNLGKSIAGKVWSVTLKAVDLVTAPIRGIMKMIANPIVAAAGVAGLSFGAKDVFETGMDFEKQMSAVRALTLASDEDHAMLTNTAKSLGASTAFSASEVASGMQSFGTAGWTPQQIKDAMPGLLDLSASDDVELGVAADIMARAMNAFKIPANEATRVADVLAAAASGSMSSVTSLGESFKYVAPVAGALGYSLEDVSIGLGLMSDGSVDASMAGTSLRSTMSRLAAPVKATQKTLDSLGLDITAEELNESSTMMKKLGISTVNSTGELKSFMSIMTELRESMSGMDGDEKAAAAKSIAGMDGMAGLLTIVNATDEAFERMTRSVYESKGVAKEMAEIRMDNIRGDVEELGGAFETLKIDIVEKLAPHIRAGLQWLTSKMPEISEVVLNTVDVIISKIEEAQVAISNMMNSSEWKNATTIWEKAGVAWKKLVTEPLGNWWNDKGGKEWVSGMVESVGRGLGSAIKGGLSALFGIDIGGAVDEGLGIGQAFAKGLSDGMEGIDWGQVFKGIGDALMGALKLAFSNPVTGTMATAWIGGKVLGGVGGIYKGVSTSMDFMKGFNSQRAVNADGAVSMFKGSSGATGIGAEVASWLPAITKFSGPVAMGTLGLTNQFQSGINFHEAYKLSEQGDEKASRDKVATGIIRYLGGTIGALNPAFAMQTIFQGDKMGQTVSGWTGRTKELEAEERLQEQLKAGQEQSKLERERARLEKEQAKYNSPELKAALADPNMTETKFSLLLDKAAEKNLEEHFGNVKLSLTEIQELSEKIVFGDSIKGMEQFAEATAKAEASFANFQSATSQMDRLSWKAGLSFELNDSEKISYKAAADNLVASAKSYIEDRHYEFTAAANLIIDPELKTSMIEGTNTVFASIQKELSGLENQLNEKMNISLKDGVITLDEQAEIQGLQSQIEGVVSKVAQAEQEAEFEMLKIKFSGAALDPESFAGMQVALAEHVKSATEKYEESLKLNIKNLKLQYPEGEESEVYQKQRKIIEEEYHVTVKNMQLDAANIQLEAIANAYEKELANILPDIEGTTTEKLSSALQKALSSGIEPAKWDTKMVVEWLGLENLEGVTQEAISNLFIAVAKMFPELDFSGIEIGTGKVEELSSASGELETNALGATGAISGLTAVLPPFATSAEGAAGGQGILQGSIDGVGSSAGTATGNVSNLSGAINSLKSKEITVKVNIETVEMYERSRGSISGLATNANGGIFGAYANGAIADKQGLRPISQFTDSRGVMGSPHIGLVGEDGPESIIPLSKKRRKRGIALWQRAGQMLGILPYADGGITGTAESAFSEEIFNQEYSNTDISPMQTIAPMFPNSESNTNNSTAISTPVTIGDITFDVNINNNEATNTESIIKILKDNVKNLTDEIARSIALALQQVYSNLPKAAGGV